jgi:hypothetical protein
MILIYLISSQQAIVVIVILQILSFSISMRFCYKVVSYFCCVFLLLACLCLILDLSFIVYIAKIIKIDIATNNNIQTSLSAKILTNLTRTANVSVILAIKTCIFHVCLLIPIHFSLCAFVVSLMIWCILL